MAAIVAVLLGGAGWLGYRAFIAGSPGTGRLSILLGESELLPDTTDRWHGRIDYQSLNKQLEALARRPEMAGLAVAVVEDGRLRFVRTYGVTDRSTGVPVTAATVFRWASVSKTATGLMASSLANDGALDVERPLSTWKTSLRLPEGAEARLSLAQLLSHQTGLTKNAYDEKLEDGQNPALLRALLAGAPLQCPPGTCHTYQNVAFDAASEILGQVAGKSLEVAVNERYFRPLGMTSAAYGEAGLTGAADWAHPHHLGDVRPVKTPYWHVPAAAGIESNIVDFAKWMQAGMGQNPDIISPAVLKLALRPRVATPPLYSGDLAKALSAATYGLGWRSFVYGQQTLVGHSGAVAGYRATMIFDPATQTGVVALWNSNWGIPFRIPFAVFDSYNKLPASRWLDLSDIPLPNPAAAGQQDTQKSNALQQGLTQ